MSEARIVNSNIILIGGVGIFLFNILCQIGDYYENGTLAEHFNLIVWIDYLPEQISQMQKEVFEFFPKMKATVENLKKGQY